jgi:sugar/nucleoside kinase (ribokinase family)
MILRALRALVIGDVMADVSVRPEGPIARGSDRRASITVQPGGSAANQAAWLTAFLVRRAAVRCYRRVSANHSTRLHSPTFASPTREVDTGTRAAA